MDFTPVQFRVGPKIKHLHREAKYLMQVWNKEGVKLRQFYL